MSPGVLTREQVDMPYLAVIHLAHQHPAVLQQVTLRPDKVSNLGHIIRFGETQGDEANGWMAFENVYVVEWIGTVDLETSKVTPFPKDAADVVRLSVELAEKVNAA